jgi:hypothetical protein
MDQLSLFGGNQDVQQGGDRPPTQNLAQPPPTQPDTVGASVQTSPMMAKKVSPKPTECYCGDLIQISGLDAYKCRSCGWITWSTYRTKRGK